MSVAAAAGDFARLLAVDQAGRWLFPRRHGHGPITQRPWGSPVEQPATSWALRSG